MFYHSKLTGGFYATEIHGDHIPADAIELTDKQYYDLILGLSQGKIIVDGVDGPTLSDPPAPSVEELAEKQRLADLRADAMVSDMLARLKIATPADISTFVNNNVTDLAGARTMFKRILLLLAAQ